MKIGLGQFAKKVLLFVFVCCAKTRFSGHLYSLLMLNVTHLWQTRRLSHYKWESWLKMRAWRGEESWADRFWVLFGINVWDYNNLIFSFGILNYHSFFSFLVSFPWKRLVPFFREENKTCLLLVCWMGGSHCMMKTFPWRWGERKWKKKRKTMLCIFLGCGGPLDPSSANGLPTHRCGATLGSEHIQWVSLPPLLFMALPVRGPWVNCQSLRSTRKFETKATLGGGKEARIFSFLSENLLSSLFRIGGWGNKNRWVGKSACEVLK